jgi:hypothetical protein
MVPDDPSFVYLTPGVQLAAGAMLWDSRYAALGLIIRNSAEIEPGRAIIGLLANPKRSSAKQKLDCRPSKNAKGTQSTLY